jgi:hypothetical protein
MANSQDIMLPAPDKTGGKPLMQALNERQSVRTFTKDNLTLISFLIYYGQAGELTGLRIKKRQLHHQGMFRKLMFMLPYPQDCICMMQNQTN